jgi:hypothetical protein
MGYAFINIKNHCDILDFYTNFHLKKWEFFKSRKVLLLYRSVKLNTRGFKAKMSLKNILKTLTFIINPKLTYNHLFYLSRN